jgi:CheY-like chemotaxis protein
VGRLKLRILVAEDNPVNRLVAVRILEKLGHETTTVENGELAVKATVRGGFDLVLMDIQMPVMGGFEATAAIRARGGSQDGHLPIVGITAHALKGDMERCLEAGMDAYLSKPIKVADLSAIIERVTAPATGAGNPSVAQGQRDRSVFDPDLALEYSAGDAALLDEIVQLWQEDTPYRLVEIRNGIAGSDASVIERAAHRLRGSLGTLAAALATEAAERLETLAAAGDLSTIADAAAALETEVERLRLRLERLAKHGAAA